MVLKEMTNMGTEKEMQETLACGAHGKIVVPLHKCDNGHQWLNKRLHLF